MTKTALRVAIDTIGNNKSFSERIGVAQQRVSNWHVRGVPADVCPAIEAATGVTCEALRPDVTWTRDEAGAVTGYHVAIPHAAA